MKSLLYGLKKFYFFIVVFGVNYLCADIIPPASLPLRAQGNQIVTVDGKPVRIKGVNWFGFESDLLVPHGIWGARSYKDMMNQIKQVGFNTIRLPFCNEMFNPGSTAKNINYYANPDLKGLTPLEILDKIVAYADEIGLSIILDHHRNDAGIGALNNGLWYMHGYPESRFIDDWVMLAQRYKNNRSVIGADLHNEPHGPATWGTGGPTDWKAAAERTGNAILKVNPDWLIIVEGIESYDNQSYWWGGNLLGVKDHPVILSNNAKLVYSTHEYPTSIYAQPWFNAPDYPDNLPAKFRQMWGYIFENNTAPIFIGELGSRFENPKDIAWIKKLTAYMNGDFTGTGRSELAHDKQGVSFAYWSWNPNSGDTGGILQDDWKTVHQHKLASIQPIMEGPSVLGAPVAAPPPMPIKQPVPQPAPEKPKETVVEKPVVQPEVAEREIAVEVVYQITDQWHDGFIADVKLNNIGKDPIKGWEITFEFPENQTVTNSWNGHLVGTNLGPNRSTVVIENDPWNSIIPAGQSATFGFQGAFKGQLYIPKTFFVNDVRAKVH